VLGLFPPVRAGIFRAPSARQTNQPRGNLLFDFSTDENPLAGWRHGQTHGLDWNNVQALGGVACGAHIADGPSYDDPIATPDLVFPRKQFVEGEVYIAPGYAPGAGHELELHLHTTITNNGTVGSITSYEFLHDVINDTFQAVRWDGPIGTFDFGISITVFNGGPTAAVDGTVFRFQDDGAGNFSVYQDGVLKWTFTDTTHQGGAPGIAFFWTNAACVAGSVGWKWIRMGVNP
jgi:hypothetical protein